MHDSHLETSRAVIDREIAELAHQLHHLGEFAEWEGDPTDKAELKRRMREMLVLLHNPVFCPAE